VQQRRCNTNDARSEGRTYGVAHDEERNNKEGDHDEETIRRGGKFMQETSRQGGWSTKSDRPYEACLDEE
jgi:hypothetical protein